LPKPGFLNKIEYGEKQRSSRKESEKEWQKESPIAYDLRDEISQWFRLT
jgi:hypothetical protein